MSAETIDKTTDNGIAFWLLKAVKYFGFAVLGLLGLLVVISVTGIAIPLNFLKDAIEETIWKTSGRKLTIEGDIGLIPGFSPEISIEDIKLGNPEPWGQSQFASIDEISAQIHLLPLLDSKIHIGYVEINGVSLELLKSVDGNANWIFSTRPASREHEKSESDVDNKIEIVAVDKIDLSNISLIYKDNKNSQKTIFTIDEAQGSALKNQPIDLNLDGTVNQKALSIQLQTASLDALMHQTMPLRLQGHLGKMEFQIAGNMTTFSEIDMTVRIFGKSLAELDKTLGLSLPAINQYDISAALSLSGNTFGISGLKAAFDDSLLVGNFDIDFSDRPLKAVGEIRVEHLNLEPFLSETDDRKEVNAEREIEEPILDDGNFSSLKDKLLNLDIDFTLGVKSLKLAGVHITDSTVHLQLQDGKLQTPLLITLNEIPLQGNLQMQGSEQGLELSANLQVENTNINDLEQWIGLKNIDGSLKKLTILVETHGEDIKTLVTRLHGQLSLKDARLSYSKENDEGALEFEIAHLVTSVSTSQPLSLKATGVMLNEAFELSLKGGNLKQLLKGKLWPIALQANGGGASLNILGQIIASTRGKGSEISVNLSGERFGDLKAWSGIETYSDASYQLSANPSFSSTGWAISDLLVRLGNTTISGMISKTTIEEKDHILLQLLSELIDLPEITGIFSNPDITEEKQRESGVEPTAENGTPQRLKLNMPVLPQAIEIADTEIEVKINALLLDDFDVRNVEFNGTLHNGKLQPSPFSMQLGDAEFNGDIAFDSLAKQPRADFHLSTNNIDIGALLRELQLTDDIKISAKTLGLEMMIRGESLEKALRNSEISAYISEGEWILENPGNRGKLPIAIESAELHLRPNQPITLSQLISIKEQPMTLEIEIDHPSVVKESGEMNLKIVANHADTELLLTGQTMLPFRSLNLELALELKGPLFNAMNSIVGIRLPEIGPYEINGNFGIRENGYFIDNLKTKIGDSVLQGHASLQTNTTVPEFDVELTASNIQLNDFNNDMHAIDFVENSDPTDESEIEPVSEEISVEEKPNKEPLFTAESLALANGTFHVRAKNVYSGTDRLGEGKLSAALQNSQLRIDPITLNVPGGEIDAKLTLRPEGDGVKAHLTANVDNFNYGIMARRVKPETEMSGLIFLDIEIDSQTRHLGGLLRKAHGHLDFAVIPYKFEAGIIDLWAVGLLHAILPKINSDISVVNCLIARFDIEDGVMEENALILDTSKLRATGKGHIDFNTQELFIRLKPEAKRPQIFRIEAPIEIEGSFANIGFGLGDGLFGTGLRTLTTTATTPFKQLFGKKIPRDGSDICGDPMLRDSRKNDS